MVIVVEEDAEYLLKNELLRRIPCKLNIIKQLTLSLTAFIFFSFWVQLSRSLGSISACVCLKALKRLERLWVIVVSVDISVEELVS